MGLLTGLLQLMQVEQLKWSNSLAGKHCIPAPLHFPSLEGSGVEQGALADEKVKERKK